MKKVLREVSKCLPRVASFIVEALHLLLGCCLVYEGRIYVGESDGFILSQFKYASRGTKGSQDLSSVFFKNTHESLNLYKRGNAHNGLEKQLREVIDI